MSNKETYRIFCTNYEVPLFFKPYWLDTCELPWEVIMAEFNGIQAFWINHIEHNKGLKFIRNQHLMPYSGLLFSRSDIDLNVQQVLIELILKQLPTFDVLEIDLSTQINLSAQFEPFNSSLRKTNLLDLSLDLPQIYAAFKPSLKRQIRKADRTLHLFESDDVELFYDLHRKTFAKQNIEPGISLSVYKQYWETCITQKCGKLFFIEDEQENKHAALWLAFDDEHAYYLAGGTNATYYGSGAMSRLMWHAIQESKKMGKKIFDFEGSMLPNVDLFFKTFSPTEVHYLHLSRINSILYKLFKKI